MTLRARLIAAFTLLLLVVVAAFGVVAVRSTQRVLIGQIDDRIAAVLARASRLTVDSLPNNPAVNRLFAELLLGEDRRLIAASPSGLEGEPDPLPAIDHLPLPADRRGQIVTVPAAAGDFSYRAGVVRTRGGLTIVYAQPLREVEAATRFLTRRMLVAGALILTAGLVAVWLTVRNGLRPINDMIATASAIAEGDLARRIPEAEPESELGRLGSALNHMLWSIETAFAAEARAKDQLKQFVADASHELRTPLSAISGYAELHRKGALDQAGGTDHAMRRIEAEGRRMASLVEDLLLLARLDLAEPIERRPLDLTGIVRDAAADSTAIDPERAIDVEAVGPVWIAGHEERLMQVFANLFANVRTHTPPATGASVTLRENGETAEVVVTDHGSGFPPAGFAKVFDRFARFHTNTPGGGPDHRGAGLGLAIVAAIVAAHGGTVVAENAEGAGARIIVRIPRIRL